MADSATRLQVQPWDEAPPATVCGAPEEGALNESDQAPRKHVFAVNSSPDFLLVVREVLADEGYAVTTSNFEPNVFTRIVMRHPDALMIDVAPGESAGWDLLRRLHLEATTSGIPVLVDLHQSRAPGAGPGRGCLVRNEPVLPDETAGPRRAGQDDSRDGWRRCLTCRRSGVG